MDTGDSNKKIGCKCTMSPFTWESEKRNEGGDIVPSKVGNVPAYDWLVLVGLFPSLILPPQGHLHSVPYLAGRMCERQLSARRNQGIPCGKHTSTSPRSYATARSVSLAPPSASGQRQIRRALRPALIRVMICNGDIRPCAWQVEFDDLLPHTCAAASFLVSSLRWVYPLFNDAWRKDRGSMAHRSL